MNQFISELIILAPPLLLALTLHEVAHGYVAYLLGDPTAKALGRLSLNPLKHLDPIGTIVFFFIQFGWAKPVPVTPRYFKDPKRALLWVALAGPTTNLVLALGSGALFKGLWLILSHPPYSNTFSFVMNMLFASVKINLILCILNFLPIPPLDGSKILMGLLPDNMAASFMKLERYGFIIVLILAFSGILSKVITPVIIFAKGLLLL